MDKLIKIIAIALKIALIGFITSTILENINPKVGFFEQNWKVWVLLYLPLFMGYDSLISLIFNSSKDE